MCQPIPEVLTYSGADGSAEDNAEETERRHQEGGYVIGGCSA